MLKIEIPADEYWDESKCEFVNSKGQTLQLEHSLVSISKWESKWHKEFLSNKPMTHEETIDYVKCMTLTQNVDPEVYERLSRENIEAIKAYIEDPMTASSVRDEKPQGSANKERVTSELIYYWMIALNIPMECQKWHLNRLLMLIRICNAKNTPPKKHSTRDLYRHHNAVNAANRKRFHSRG